MIYYIRDDNNHLIGFRYYNRMNEETYYYVKNAQEDIIGILDSDYNKIATYEYDAWGKIVSIKDSNNNEITDSNHIAIINPFRYRSYYYDEETKLYYLNSRYYDPNFGRFINADGTIGANEDVISHNLFVYCSNNPINSTDLEGDFALPWMVPIIKTVEVVFTAAVAYVGAKAFGTVTSQVYSNVATKSKIKSKKVEYPELPDDTIVYRWNGTNPGNLTPKPKDLVTKDGRKPSLSFSLVPPVLGQKAGMTTVGALRGTGILNAKQDAPNHVAVTPRYDTMENWVRFGTSHPCTIAVKSVIVKWEG